MSRRRQTPRKTRARVEKYCRRRDIARMDAGTLELARRLLDTTGVSRHVAASTLDALLAGSTFRTYRKGQTIYRKGDAETQLLLLLTGTVEASTGNAEGRRTICWYLGAGHWLGLIAMLDEQGSVHDIRAHADTTALAIPRPLFLEALANDANLGIVCLRILSKRSRTLYENQAADALLTLRGRIVRLLLLLHQQPAADSTGRREQGLQFVQEDFAAMLGTSRQTLNRELRSLEAEGLLSIGYLRIQLLDIPALKAVASKSIW